MTRRGQKKGLYREGFLCMYDLQGEMFYRPKTELSLPVFDFDEVIEFGLIVGYSTNADAEQEQLYEDFWVASDADVLKTWPQHLLDVSSMYAYDEYNCAFEFAGHFDLTPKFGIGTGSMQWNGEDWEYEYSDPVVSGLNIGLLRVTFE